MVRLSIFTATLASFPLIFAIPAAEIFNRDERNGCGTEEPPVEFLEAVAAFDVGDAKLPEASAFRVAAFGGDPFEKPIVIKTWLHVVAGAETLSEGWIPDNQLKAQMDVLNEAFAPSNIQFVTEGITRTVNANWTIDAPGGEFEMKSTLRKGDYKTLNMYFQKRLRNNALGYAYYPQPNVVPGSGAFILYGATNLYSTVPGGSATNYNLGHTATHEIGHWLGLMHTFQGLSCTGPGDLIADTAIHNAPSRGCPVGLDSCIDDEGPDPIHNYMDYSTDACFDHFTPLQTKRMHDMWNMYINPRTCHSDNCVRALRANTIPGRLAESQAFCADYTKFIVTDLTLVKPYAVSACTGNVISRVSSACSCLPTPSA